MHFFWLLNVVETSHPSETLVRFLCFLTALTGSNWKDFCQRSALAMRPEALMRCEESQRRCEMLSTR